MKPKRWEIPWHLTVLSNSKSQWYNDLLLHCSSSTVSPENCCLSNKLLSSMGNIPGGIPIFDMPSWIQRLFFTKRKLGNSGAQWLGTSVQRHDKLGFFLLLVLNSLHQRWVVIVFFTTLDLGFASSLWARIYFDSFWPQQHGNLGTARKKKAKGFTFSLINLKFRVRGNFYF